MTFKLREVLEYSKYSELAPPGADSAWFTLTAMVRITIAFALRERHLVAGGHLTLACTRYFSIRVECTWSGVHFPDHLATNSDRGSRQKPNDSLWCAESSGIRVDLSLGHRCYISPRFFFLTPYRHPVKFRDALKDTLKSGQSSDLGRSFSCRGPCHDFTWSANTNNSRKIGRMKPLSKLPSVLVRKWRDADMGLKKRGDILIIPFRSNWKRWTFQPLVFLANTF